MKKGPNPPSSPKVEDQPFSKKNFRESSLVEQFYKTIYEYKLREKTYKTAIEVYLNKKNQL